MLARRQGRLVRVQSGVHIRFFFVGHASVDDAGYNHISAACHLAHSRDSVLSIYDVEFAVPEADNDGMQFPAVPVMNQLIDVFLLHGPLVGKVGG